MALDEPRDGDEQYQVGDTLWVVSREERDFVLGPDGIRIDHVSSPYGAGFQIEQRGRHGFGC